MKRFVYPTINDEVVQHLAATFKQTAPEAVPEEHLEKLPRNYGKRIFSKTDMEIDTFRDNYAEQRDRTAEKIQNPHLSKIMFKTMRT